jgi:hypothetical protein
MEESHSFDFFLKGSILVFTLKLFYGQPWPNLIKILQEVNQELAWWFASKRWWRVRRITQLKELTVQDSVAVISLGETTAEAQYANLPRMRQTSYRAAQWPVCVPSLAGVGHSSPDVGDDDAALEHMHAREHELDCCGLNLPAFLIFYLKEITCKDHAHTAHHVPPRASSGTIPPLQNMFLRERWCHPATPEHAV